MSIVCLETSLRARLSRMADEHMAMQERLMTLPEHEVVPFLKKMEEHSIELSRLAGRLEGGDAETGRPGEFTAEAQSAQSSAASPLTPHASRLEE